MSKQIVFAMILFLSSSLAVNAADLPHVDVWYGDGTPGSTVILPITVTNVSGAAISSFDLFISYDSTRLGALSAAIGPAASNAGKTVSSTIVSPDSCKVSVLGAGNSPIGDGTVAYLSVPILGTASIGVRYYLVPHNISALDTNGNPVAVGSYSGYVNVVIPQYIVQITKSGTGSGTFTIDPPGAVCNDTYSGSYPQGSVLSLHVSPDQYSVFTVSGGRCIPFRADCTITCLNADTSITVNFDVDVSRMARIASSLEYYPSLQSALDAASDGATIQLWAVQFSEDLSVNKNIVLEGGYDSEYLTNADFSTVKGSVTVQAGQLQLENIVIQ